MMSWRLWGALRNPPTFGVLFRRTLARRSQIWLPRGRFSSFIESLFAIVICIVMLSPLAFIIAIGGLLMLFNGTVYSLVWAMQASGILAGNRQSEIYDMLCVIPQGALGLHWSVCTACLHRQNRLEQIHGLVRSILLIFLGLVLVVTVFMLPNASGVSGRYAVAQAQQGATSLLVLATAVVLLYIDHIQSVVVASVLGMLMPTYTNRSADAQLMTAAFYLLIQVTTYVILGVVALNALPALFRDVQGWFAPIAQAIIIIAAFYSAREVAVRLLWHLLLERLNTAPGDLDYLDLAKVYPWQAG
jgi:hypothetical protein